MANYTAQRQKELGELYATYRASVCISCFGASMDPAFGYEIIPDPFKGPTMSGVCSRCWHAGFDYTGKRTEATG